jgi:ribA/ribD-fused uncharacterized protein
VKGVIKMQFRGSYIFLSNFYRAHVEYEGLTFWSVEAAFQAAKTLDPKERERFTGLSPAEAKREGRRVRLRPDWEKVKIEVMKDLIRQKFKDEKLRKLLIETGSRPIVEENYWHDNFWGSCICPRCQGVPGKNVLGRILEEVRDEIKES